MADLAKPAEVELAELMKDYVGPSLPSKCTWHPSADPQTSPHFSGKSVHEGPLFANILETIGKTPMVKLNRIPQSLGLQCDVYVKCEFLNPAGSVKDRIAVRMIEDAERDGRLTPGATIIEPSSGNTGIALAMAAAVKGYNCVIITPEKTSAEKVALLRALGARVLLVPLDVPMDAPNGVVGLAHVLNKQTPNSVVLAQFRNASNPMAHYDETAEEILAAFNDDGIDMFVAGIGTGGTLTGVARKLRERCPRCLIVGVDPEGSVHAPTLTPTATTRSAVVEADGFNYHFVPTTLDRELIDRWVKLGDAASFALARRLVREEGLLCGATSAFNVAAALTAASELGAGQRCVVVLPDDARNYLATIACDQWMEAKRLQPCVNRHQHPWWEVKLASLQLSPPATLDAEASCQEAMRIMEERSIEQIPIRYVDSARIGVLTTRLLTQKLMDRSITLGDPVKMAATFIYLKVTSDDTLGLVSRIMEIEQFVLVTDALNGATEIVTGLITNLDFISILSKHYASNSSLATKDT